MSLKAKIETAFTTVLKASAELPDAFKITMAGVDGVQDYRIYEGHSSKIKQAPYVVCEARAGSDEEPLGSGNRFFDVVISIHGQAETSEEDGLDDEGNSVTPVPSPEAQRANAEAIFSILKEDDLPELLSDAVEDFYVFDPVTDTGEDPSLSGRQFVDSLMLRIYCCGTDIL